MFDPMTPVRLRLDDLRKARGMSQKELAKKAGVSENTISKLIGRPRQIRLDTIDRLCDALNVEPGELFVRDASN